LRRCSRAGGEGDGAAVGIERASVQGRLVWMTASDCAAEGSVELDDGDVVQRKPAALVP